MQICADEPDTMCCSIINDIGDACDEHFNDDDGSDDTQLPIIDDDGRPHQDTDTDDLPVGPLEAGRRQLMQGNGTDDDSDDADDDDFDPQTACASTCAQKLLAAQSSITTAMASQGLCPQVVLQMLQFDL